jgi:hypothetical protein
METQVEFNTVKVLKIINRDDLLKSAYNEDNEPFNLNKLTTQAVEETLSDDALGSLKDIFDIICTRQSYLDDYIKVEVVEKHPRRYGKKQIEKDIIEQGGVADENQLTMLALNELKSAYMNLQGKGTSDRYAKTQKISVKEGKAIRAWIRTFINQTEKVRARKVG